MDFRDQHFSTLESDNTVAIPDSFLQILNAPDAVDYKNGNVVRDFLLAATADDSLIRCCRTDYFAELQKKFEKPLKPVLYPLIISQNRISLPKHFLIYSGLQQGEEAIIAGRNQHFRIGTREGFKRERELRQIRLAQKGYKSAHDVLGTFKY